MTARGGVLVQTHVRQPPVVATTPHCLHEGDYAREEFGLKDEREALAAIADKSTQSAS
jgi:hypothetical protein